MTDDDDTDDDDEDYEDHVYFEGPCTCDHEPEDHSWIGCAVDDCKCEANWTE